MTTIRLIASCFNKKRGIFNIPERFFINVVEVGSSGGPSKEFKKFADLISYYGFEPNMGEYNRLNKKNKQSSFRSEKYLPYAIGIDNKTMQFNIYSRKSCSSLLEAYVELAKQYSRDDYFNLIGKDFITTRSLDSLVREGVIPTDISILKLDTEGSELSILENAEMLLKSVKAVRVEVSFMNIHKDQPLFYDINGFLRRCGFVFQGFIEMHHWNHYAPDKKNRKKSLKNIPLTRASICHADALYFKSEVYEKFFTSDEGINYDDLIKMILVCLIYGFYDKAYFIAEKTSLDKIVEKEYGIDIKKLISKMSRRDSFLRKLEKWKVTRVKNAFEKIIRASR